MKVLIVWELIPEETQAFVVDVTDADDLEKLKRCHGYYVNGTDMDEELSNWISEWMLTVKDEKIDLIPDNGPVSIGDCELMIHTGFFL